MGRVLHYRPGSYYVADDRTGFPQRAERTRREWNGLRVDESVWEPRQPQDLVRGVRDQQAAPDPRPLAPNQFIGPVFVQTSANAMAGQTVIQLQDASPFYTGVAVSVMLDSGVNFNTTVASVSAASITLAAGLPFTAASGNVVTRDTMNVPASQEPWTQGG